MHELKLVVVTAQGLPVGLAANAATIAAMAMADKVKFQGEDVVDADGVRHVGITTISIRLLEASAETLKGVHSRALSLPDVRVSDVPAIAQQHHDAYEAYAAALAAAGGEAVQYAAVALLGPVKSINSLTGAMRLFGKVVSPPVCGTPSPTLREP